MKSSECYNLKFVNLMLSIGFHQSKNINAGVVLHLIDSTY